MHCPDSFLGQKDLFSQLLEVLSADSRISLQELPSPEKSQLPQGPVGQALSSLDIPQTISGRGGEGKGGMKARPLHIPTHLTPTQDPSEGSSQQQSLL